MLPRHSLDVEGLFTFFNYSSQLIEIGVRVCLSFWPLTVRCDATLLMLAAFTFENPLGYLSEWFRSSFFFNWSRLLKPTGLAGKKENLTASSTENYTYICIYGVQWNTFSIHFPL